MVKEESNAAFRITKGPYICEGCLWHWQFESDAEKCEALHEKVR